jgi:hypothetical protein
MPGRSLVVAVLLAAGAACLPAALVESSAEEEADDAWRTVVRPFLERHCVSCHSGPLPQGQLSLAGLASAEDAGRRGVPWRRLRDRVARGEMPPQGSLRPSPGARTAFLDRVAAYVAPVDPGDAGASPGRVTLRRLNRREYENTVRDLLGVDVRADALFPADDVGYGFDNVGDVLSLPPVLLEKYLIAAERIAAEAIVDRDPGPPPALRFADRALEAQGGARWPGRAPWALTSNGEVYARPEVTRDGTYRIRAHAFAQQAGPDPARLELRVDGRVLAGFDVRAEQDAPEAYEAVTTLPAGTHRVGAAFVNDYFMPQAEDPRQRDRNLYVLDVEVEGPIDPLPPTAFQERHLPRPAAPGEEASRLRSFVEAVAPRAWRRPVGAEEIERLIAVANVDPEASVEARARTALTALLVSPHFVFRVEAEPGADEETVALTDHQLAARLAYFLWSSLPDARLTALADAGRLRDPDALEAQAARMLRDPRATALAEGFAAQWLKLGELTALRPDPERYPGVDAALLGDMRQETLLFFEAVLREERDVRELLSADFTFANERLATHYGIPGVRGPHLRRVALPTGRRGGVLLQASVLTATSNPDRTSPVKRGKWILETLLDRPPPPPPANAGALDESAGPLTAASVREQLARHRADPLCAACHDALDPLGFALEHYDGVGRWRAADGETPVDASGVLPDGRALAGAGDLVSILAADEAFPRSLAKHLLVYALGRGVDEADEPAVAGLAAALAAEPTLTRLVREIVRLDAFRLRARPSPPPENPPIPAGESE